MSSISNIEGKYQTTVVNGGQIYISSNYGQTWTATEGNRGWYGISMSANGQYQSAVSYNSNIYISSNYGQTWTATESKRGWYGISISANGQYQTAFTHPGNIYTSSDYGKTWKEISIDRYWYRISISENGQYQTAVSYMGKICTSKDYGITWKEIGSVNRAWRNVCVSYSGKYQTALEYRGNIYISSDYGITWNKVESPRMWSDIAISSYYELIPNKVVISNLTPSNNSINLSYKIPDNSITKYKIKSYYTDNDITKCGPSLNVDMTNINDPYYNILNKATGTDVTINVPNLINRYSFTSSSSTLPSCEPYDNNYSIISYKPMRKESYVFTIKSTNSVGESEYSDQTQDIVPIVNIPTNINMYIIIGVILTILIFGIGIWYYLKNKVT